jgi:hypothetical protein
MDENRYAGTPWKAVSRRTILASTVYGRPQACHNFKLPGGLRAAWGLSNGFQGEGTDG